MNRRKFFSALVGYLAALPLLPAILKQEKPKIYWSGTNVPRNLPHPFQNNGASSGRCRVCNGFHYGPSAIFPVFDPWQEIEQAERLIRRNSGRSDFA